MKKIISEMTLDELIDFKEKQYNRFVNIPCFGLVFLSFLMVLMGLLFDINMNIYLIITVFSILGVFIFVFYHKEQDDRIMAEMKRKGWTEEYGKRKKFLKEVEYHKGRTPLVFSIIKIIIFMLIINGGAYFLEYAFNNLIEPQLIERNLIIKPDINFVLVFIWSGIIAIFALFYTIGNQRIYKMNLDELYSFDDSISRGNKMLCYFTVGFLGIAKMIMDAGIFTLGNHFIFYCFCIIPVFIYIFSLYRQLKINAQIKELGGKLKVNNFFGIEEKNENNI